MYCSVSYFGILIICLLHLLILTDLVFSKKSFIKPIPTSYENEIFDRKHLITMKFPKIEVPVRPKVSRRQFNTKVNPVQENCRNQTFRTELSRLRQKVKCEPRDVVVDLIPPLGATLTPNAVVVKRCGGMCNGFKKCQPTIKQNVKFYVKTIKDNQIHCSSITVSEDVRCQCGCVQKPSDCGQNEIYRKDKCACVCKNEDYATCMENSNANMFWDESTCSCICQQIKPCTTGTYWSTSECRCVKELF